MNDTAPKPSGATFKGERDFLNISEVALSQDKEVMKRMGILTSAVFTALSPALQAYKAQATTQVDIHKNKGCLTLTLKIAEVGYLDWNERG